MRDVPESVVPGPSGYLELSDELMNRLVCKEPLEKYYEVEDEPFASGKYASVRRCRERTSGRQFAAKFLKKRNRSKNKRDEILHEVAVLEACQPCSRIVNLHQVFESNHDMVLLLELACGGELQMLLDSDEVPTEGQVQTLMKQIMEGISYLHGINIAHLDIKPQNLVLTGTFPNCQVKLCDFGISRYLTKGADVREIVGTPDYVAPEVLNYESISLATDMWSVGVLLYVLLTGCSPFGGDTKQETFCNISQCRLDFPDDLFDEISEEAKNLMTKLMVKNPSERLTAKQCLEHAWFAKDFGESPLPAPIDVPAPAPQPSPRLTLKIPAPKESTANDNSPVEPKEPRTPDNNNVREVKGLSEERRRSLRSNLDNLVKRLDVDTKVTRVDSFSRNRASRMQTMPSIRYSNINDSASMVFKFQRAVVIDEDEGLPPSPVSTDNSSMSDSNSDTVSEMSIDSSSDRSSIISLDDSLEFPYKLRHYSSCHNVWEAARSQRPSTRQWPPKECNDSFVKALSKFRTDARPKLTVFNGPQRRSIGLDIVQENGNLVVIREHKAVNHRFATTRELKCESVRSKIKKFQLPETKPELNNVF
ncbi:hypothetical protein GE061_014760 [Apolygus lucorum]|uniref:non-specific serine/threonine protein kinase n=1 Tax=Apolygus lucorum TaxID=248454 RepID=A0A6A4JEN2_APOLU|nr:hypothetical protein GE061_014760 [Apolygus lucorum]